VLIAHLLANLRNGFVDVMAHFPIRLRAANLQHEAFEHGAPLHRMRHFRVPLQAVEMACLVGHCRDRARFGGRHQLEARRHFQHLVTVAHPDLQHAVTFRRGEVANAFEQARMIARAHLGVTEFAQVTIVDLAAKLLGHRLHAVADAEHRHAEFEHCLRHARRIGLRDRARTAREDHALRREVANEGRIDVVRMDLRVHVRLADATCNQLGDLRTKVENQDLVMHGSGRHQK
jgi:hypothetical protein